MKVYSAVLAALSVSVAVASPVEQPGHTAASDASDFSAIFKICPELKTKCSKELPVTSSSISDNWLKTLQGDSGCLGAVSTCLPKLIKSIPTKM